jgi:putative endonuclease
MKNITEKRKTGNLGEDLACRFLMKHGYTIVERNYLKKCGEIDIIAKKKDILYFIEVKAVSADYLSDKYNLPNISSVSDETSIDGYFRPEDNVHPWKLQRLARTIQIYLLERNVSPETSWQFDVITVYIDKKRLVSKVSILENIVL